MKEFAATEWERARCGVAHRLPSSLRPRFRAARAANQAALAASTPPRPRTSLRQDTGFSQPAETSEIFLLTRLKTLSQYHHPGTRGLCVLGGKGGAPARKASLGDASRGTVCCAAKRIT
jgi:hypothetical protein